MPTQNIFNLLDTWASGGGPYTSIKMNATDNDVGSASLLMDLQVGGSSRFSVSKFGVLTAANRLDVQGISVCFQGQAGTLAWSGDTFITRRAAANLRLGAADAAAPVAQTLSVQSGTAGASALSCSISGTTLTVGGAVTGTIAIGHAVTGTGVSAGTVITAGSGTTWTVNNSQTVSSTTMYFNSVGQNLTITGSQGSGPSAGGSIVFQVAPAGSAATTAQNALSTALTIGSNLSATFGGTNASFVQQNGGGFYAATSAGAIRAEVSQFGIRLSSALALSWSDSTNPASVIDVLLYRDAANTLALRNGAAAQTFRVYNTTDGTNSEFGKIAWSSNVLQIGTEKAGTGTARALHLQTDGTTRLQIGSGLTISGATVTQLDGADFFTGAGGVLTVRSGSGYSGATLYSSGEGLLRVSGGTGTDIRMMFGGATSSFPALKRSSTTLQARLADDSAFASVQGKLTTDTAYQAGAPTATGYLILYDSTGTAYRVPAVLN